MNQRAEQEWSGCIQIAARPSLVDNKQQQPPNTGDRNSMKSNGSPGPVGAPHTGSNRHLESRVGPGAPCTPVYLCSSQSSSSQSTYEHAGNPRRSPDQQWTPRLRESARKSSTTDVTSK
ncbi:hypothetical protein GmHk_07G019699 [Glycine max]|nr:hypothetical protein GmHk_07G019699 [Glycine max]